MTDVYVTLSMAGYKPLWEPEHGRAFLEILQRAGQVYVPEIGEGPRTKYRPIDPDTLVRAWSRETSIVFRRRRPFEVDTYVTIDLRDREEGVPPRSWATTDFSTYVDAAYFSTPAQLDELLGLGSALYDFFSPYYGFIVLPWMRKLASVIFPDQGIPGLGWATWLGPEYDDLVQFPPLEGVSVQPMANGGRLIVLPRPRRVEEPDEAVQRALDSLLSHIDPLVFQAERPDPFAPMPKRAVRVPKFRFKLDSTYSDLRPSMTLDPAIVTQIGATPEFVDLLSMALTHAVDSAKEGPFSPFAILDAGGQRALVRVAATTTEEGLPRAYDTVRAEAGRLTAYAIAYVTSTVAEDRRSKAIVVEAAERNRPYPVKLVQRYRPRRGQRRFELIGSTTLTAEGAQLLWRQDHRGHVQ